MIGIAGVSRLLSMCALSSLFFFKIFVHAYLINSSWQLKYFFCFLSQLFLSDFAFSSRTNVNRTVYLCCSIDKHLYSFFPFFSNHLKVEKPTKKTNTHEGMGLREEEAEEKKKEKSENPISAPCSEACRAQENRKRERE